MKYDCSHFARNLQHLRGIESLSDKQLAKILGHAPSVIERIERGEERGLYPNLIGRICSFFDVSPSAFLGEDLTTQHQTLETRMTTLFARSAPITHLPSVMSSWHHERRNRIANGYFTATGDQRPKDEHGERLEFECDKFSHNLTHLRELDSLSPGELAKIVGVRLPVIKAIEASAPRTLTPSLIGRLCSFFYVDPTQFFCNDLTAWDKDVEQRVMTFLDVIDHPEPISPFRTSWTIMRLSRIHYGYYTPEGYQEPSDND